MEMTLRERRKQQLRDEILETAVGIVSSRGFSRLSMEELALQVGISKPTLYSHFATKDDLLLAASVYKLNEFVTLVESDDGDPPLLRLTTALRGVLQRQIEARGMNLRPWPELMRMMCEAPESLALLQRIEASIRQLIALAQQQGAIDPHLPHDVVEHLFFALASSMRDPYRMPVSADRQKDVADGIVALFARAVTPIIDR